MPVSTPKPTDMARVVAKFIAVCLLAYFVSRIVSSVTKLKERKIGTTVARRSSSIIYYPSMTFCLFRNRDGLFIKVPNIISLPNFWY